MRGRGRKINGGSSVDNRRRRRCVGRKKQGVEGKEIVVRRNDEVGKVEVLVAGVLNGRRTTDPS